MATKVIPKEVGDTRVPFDPDFHVLQRIRDFQNGSEEKGIRQWPNDPLSEVRFDKTVGKGKQAFRYEWRKYFVGSTRLHGGVDVPGMVLLRTDEMDRLQPGDFHPCITDHQLVELRDHLNGERTITLEEHRADAAAKNMRVQELTKYGERVETASDEEKVGRALRNLPPRLRLALLKEMEKEVEQEIGIGKPKAPKRAAGGGSA